MNEHFGDVLKQYVVRAEQTAGRLERLTEIPKQTIVSWLEGRVKRPRSGPDILRLAAALRLTEVETDHLLQAAGHPLLSEWIERFQSGTDESPGPLLAFWLDLRQSSASPPADEWQTPFQAPPMIRHFIGRQQLIEAVSRELLAGQICVLQGMAGSGKTVLAAHLAYALREQFPDGVLWADLVGVVENGRLKTSTLRNILSTFAEAYGVQLNDQYHLEACSGTVRNILANKKVLIILDNVVNQESVAPLLPPSGECATLITTHDRTLLTTHAVTFTIGPLTQAESLALLERFLGQERLTQQRQYAEAIVSFLDHHPLAVNIVANELRQVIEALTLKEYYERLRDAAAVYGDTRNIYQSVRLSLTLSYASLDGELQSLLAILSLFNGYEFSAAAVAAMLQYPVDHVAALLSHLHARSLVEMRQIQSGQVPSGSQETVSQAKSRVRYQLHFLVQMFAAKKMAESHKEAAILKQRLVAFYAHFVHENRRNYEVLATDWDTLLAALQWSYEQQAWELLEQMVGALTDIHLGTVGFWDVQGYWQEAREYLGILADSPVAAVDSLKQALILVKLGGFALRQAELGVAGEYVQRGIELLEGLPVTDETRLILAYAHDFLYQLAAWQDDNQQALAEIEQSLKVLQGMYLEDRKAEGYLHVRHASALAQLGRFDEAEAAVKIGLFFLQTEPSSARVSGLMNLGILHDIQGDTEEAIATWMEGKQLAEAVGDSRRLAGLWRNIGSSLTNSGRIHEATAPKQEALAIYQRIGDVEGVVSLYSNLAEDYILLEEYETAQRYLSQALAEARQHQLVEAELFALVNMARWYMDMNELTAVQIILDNVLSRSQQYKPVQNSLELSRLQVELAYRDGRYEQALAQIESVLAAANEREKGLLWRLKGDALRASGHWTEAETAYQTSLAFLQDRNEFEAARTQAALDQLHQQPENKKKVETWDILLPERFVREKLIASGGQANVYLGQDKETGQPIIIKSLKPEVAELQPEMAARFMHEATILASLQHPNIVQLLMAGRMGGIYATILPYFSRSLRDLLTEQAPLPLPLFGTIAVSVADALAYCHQWGVLHRDLKPENILLADNNVPHLTDFGIARDIYLATRLTAATAVMGTPDYIAPEIYQGMEPDELSDIWSLGIVWYEMLVGERPFAKSTPEATMYAILDHRLPDLLQIRPDLPLPLVQLIQEMLTKDRYNRLNPMSQILDRLKALSRLL